MFGDSIFKKVEEKSGVGKETIMSIAGKLQNANMKDETVLRDLVKELSNITGKEVSQEKEDKIVNTILKDKIPTDLDKMA